MRFGSAFETLHEALASACHVDLPNISYEQRVYEKFDAKTYTIDKEPPKFTTEVRERRPMMDEIEVIMFNQLWGSTALGYGGMGGAAMTNAYTVIATNGSGVYCVYFGGGHLAYKVDFNKMKPTQMKMFRKATADNNMPARREAINMFKGAIEGPNIDVI